MTFKADLNPKGSKSMDLLEMVKMEDYLERRRALTPRLAAKTPTPAATAILNDMLKSSKDDVGTQFRFNKNQD